jgi:hypothetical protein
VDYPLSIPVDTKATPALTATELAAQIANDSEIASSVAVGTLITVTWGTKGAEGNAVAFIDGTGGLITAAATMSGGVDGTPGKKGMIYHDATANETWETSEDSYTTSQSGWYSTANSASNIAALALKASKATNETIPGVWTFSNGMICHSFKPAANSTSAMNFYAANGTTSVMKFNTNNNRVSINITGDASYAFQVSGGIAVSNAAGSDQLFVMSTAGALQKIEASYLMEVKSQTDDVKLTPYTGKKVDINGAAKIGAASTDLITCTGRLITRTLASDPQDGTPANRPAGSLFELANYNSKLYLCIDATTPTWELITSA